MSKIDREFLGELLTAYLDGELSEAETANVQRLLRDNVEARRLHEELKRTATMVATLPRHPAPPSIIADIKLQMERTQLLQGADEPPRQSSGRHFWVLGGSAIAALILIALSVPLWYPVISRINPEASRLESDSVTKEFGGNRVREMKSVEPSPVLKPPARNYEAELLARANVTQKLEAGVPPEELRDHAYANESVRLRVFTKDANQRDAVAQQIASRFATSQMVDLGSGSTKDDRVAPSNQGFYQTGVAGVNYADTEQRQVLARVPAAAMNGLIDEVAAITNQGGAVSIAVESLSFHGSKQVRDRLHELAAVPAAVPVEVEEQAEDADAPTNGKAAQPVGFFDPLLKIVGLKLNEIIGSNGPAQRPDSPLEPETMVKSQATGDEMVTENLSAEKSELDALKQPRVDSARAKWSESMVTRRLKDMEPKDQDSVIDSGKKGATGEITKEMSEQIPAPTTAENAGRLDEPEPFVTLVIELQVAQPKPPRVDRGQNDRDTRRLRGSPNRNAKE